MNWMSVKLPDNFQMSEHSWPCRFHIKVNKLVIDSTITKSCTFFLFDVGQREAIVFIYVSYLTREYSIFSQRKQILKEMRKRGKHHPCVIKVILLACFTYIDIF
jgi:hypothetical protein